MGMPGAAQIPSIPGIYQSPAAGLESISLGHTDGLGTSSPATGLASSQLALSSIVTSGIQPSGPLTEQG